VRRCDFLIIGSGVAGLSLALDLAAHGNVHIVTKKELTDSNTNLAQGGIASVLDPADSFESHIEDTIAAGAGLCRNDVVDFVVREGPRRIRELSERGVPFTHKGESISLGLEGGHSHNRIVHCDDLTGRHIEHTLLDAVLAHEAIEVFPHHMAVNLITRKHVEPEEIGARPVVHGAYVLNAETEDVERFVAGRTILACGGAGKVYLYTTNPDIATGDGIAMAYRAGARVVNMEFVQFHPTCLYHPVVNSFLLSEALRGEGGRLVRADGSRFVDRYDPRGELAPRDIVARAIDSELKTTGDPCVYLDLTHLDAAFVERRFPNIFRQLMSLEIDMRIAPIPVVPATHYFCGGVDVNSYGHTNIENLLALGEVSHTGVHGANRLASNSLLEAIVFARRTAEGALEGYGGVPDAEVRPWSEVATAAAPPPVILEHDWNEARQVMWDYVGIVRSDQRLEIAARRMRLLSETVRALYWDCHVTPDLLELRNIILVGELIIESARRRRESRGLHYTETYPHRDDLSFRQDTVLEVEGE